MLSTLTWSGGSSLFLGLTCTMTGAVTWLASFCMMAVHLMLKEREVFLQQSSRALKRKENTEMDSEVTELKISDKARTDWDISSRGPGLTDQGQPQVDK